uniref:Cysteine protease n=1 Tax=Steinernema glaseri TaxID=37863 RepID=A0A1I7ZVE2_9BILA
MHKATRCAHHCDDSHMTAGKASGKRLPTHLDETSHCQPYFALFYTHQPAISRRRPADHLIFLYASWPASWGEMASPSTSDTSLAEPIRRRTHSRSFSDPTPSLCIINADDIAAVSSTDPSSSRSEYSSVLYDDDPNEEEDFYSSLDSAENNAKRSWLQSGFATGVGSRLSNIGSYLRSFGDPTASTESSKWSMGGKLNHVWNNFKYGKWKMRPHEGDYEKEVSIWLLGCHYHPNRVDSETRDGFQRFFIDYHSRIWLTYRTGFPPFPGTSVTSDCGWGCMLRTAQMVVAEALVQIHLGRDWRWHVMKDEKREESKFILHNRIVRLFEDHLGADLSLHRLMRIAARNTDKTPVGKWYTPSHSVALMKEALKESHSEETEMLRICLCTDGLVIKSEVEAASEGWTKSVIVVVSVRLGAFEVNSCYEFHLRNLLSLDNSLGILGGRPRHSLYFVGFYDQSLIYLDPHVAHPYKPLCFSAVDDAGDATNRWKSFHCRMASKMPICDIDPSCATAFLIRSEAEFDSTIRNLNLSQVIDVETKAGDRKRTSDPIFTAMDEPPLNIYTAEARNGSELLVAIEDHDFEVL